MSRYFYKGLFIVVTVLAVFAVIYKTSLHKDSPSVSAEFGGVSLRIDYATTEAEREKGLGGRTSVPDDYGMLFVFPKDGYYGFWMKDTLIPLDMFWLDDQGHVVFIERNVATSTYPDVFYPPVPARYVLETVAGFAGLHLIATGTPLLLKNFPSVSQ
ncbi:MAG TPA: DUF192 domain-containing protein [Candidatus Paceibacterota bacterium]|nr:DUF192 domain-containing protein [Candidatus Paceibacterota bacterium]